MNDDFVPWQKWLSADHIHLETPPIEINNFQRLLLINIFRYEKTVYAIDEFIRINLGERFSQPIVPTMDVVFNDTDYKTPLIFILSPGADPMLNLLVAFFNLAIFQRKKNIPRKVYHNITWIRSRANC